MKVGKYYIKWQYTEVNFVTLEDKIELRRGTSCSIYKEGVDDPIVKGMSICSPSDNFNKEKGRRLSFERAVSDCTLVVDEEEMVTKEYTFSKGLRAAFWEGFRTLTLKPKW